MKSSVATPNGLSAGTKHRTSSDKNIPWDAIERNHRMNFDLWHAEDIARRDDLGLESVRDAKRTIDRCNQTRNDAVEQLDVWLLQQLPPADPAPPAAFRDARHDH